MTKKEAIIYCAGYFDGEGTLGLKYRGLVPATRIVSKDKASIELVARILGGNCKPRRVRWKGKQLSGYWMWDLSNTRAQNAIRILIPFLVAKQQKAIEFCNLVPHSSGPGCPGKNTEAIQQRIAFRGKWQPNAKVNLMEPRTFEQRSAVARYAVECRWRHA